MIYKKYALIIYMRSILGIVILDNKNEIGNSYFDLSDFNFFYKATVKEFLLFGCIEITKRSNKDIISIIDLKETEFYERMKYLNLENIRYNVVYDEGKWTCIVTTQLCRKEFLLSIVMESKTNKFKNYDKIMSKYEDMLTGNYKTNDKIANIQNDTKEAKEIMMASIDKIIERGTNIEDLLNQSQALSEASKSFAINAKKVNNRCCALL